MVKKLIVIFTGMIVAFLLLELALRGIGYLHIKNIDNKVTGGDKDYLILCLGDSFTEGMGAPKGKSYPEQLEDILNSRIKSKDFKVINKGTSSCNTAQILDKFEDEVKEIQPDLVILLAGLANQWNFWGYRKYSDRKNFLSQVKDFLYKIKVYKLIRLLFFSVRDKFEPNLSKNRLTVKDVNVNKRIYELRKLGCEFLSKRKYYKAINCFEKILNISPNNPEICLKIAMIYTWDLPISKEKEVGNYKKNATKWIIRAVKLNPTNWRVLNAFVKLYRDEVISYDKYIKYMYLFKDITPIAADILAMSKKKNRDEIAHEMSKWIYSDIQKFISLCKSNNIDLIIQNYPHYKFPYYVKHSMNGLLKKVAFVHSVSFIDNRNIFENMWREGKKKKKYFSPNLHCNAKGYKVMAENIYNKIKEEEFLE